MPHANNRPLIIAHRGSSHRAPENTMSAFELAVSEGAEGIEMDVRVTRDGVPVVFHDASLKRMMGKETRVSVLDASDLARVDVGGWFNRRFPKRAKQEYSKTGVPTLVEALALLEGFSGPVYLEIKCQAHDAERTVSSVCSEIERSRRPKGLIVKSFVPDVLPLFKARCEGVSTAALFAPKVMSIIRKEKRLVNIASDLGADALSLHFSLATKKLMKRARKAGLGVAVWTVDNPRWMRRALELGLDAVITNKPAKMLLRRRELLHRNSITA